MIARARVHRGYVRMQIIALRRLTLHRMAVHTARTLDHLGGLSEQGHRTRALVADRREGRSRLQQDCLRGRFRRLRPCDAARERRDHYHRRPSMHVHQTVLNCCGSMGSVRIRLPVAAKIAFATAGPTAAVAASPMPPGASVLLIKCVSITGASSIRIGR
jgi:hypothetical protein